MFGIGMQELAIILVVALLVFGPKRLPELARTLGKGLAEFRKASSDLRQSFSLDADDSPTLRRAQTPPAEDPRNQRESESRPAQVVDAVADADERPVATDSGHGDHAEDSETAADPIPGPESSPDRSDGER
ncbi:MAG: twin-arginine translocase TatA/TatE family subunit [Deltaproteobacteria bacterium]|nr:twin-arginine translocase TatA/TatE family subunit [Deltaproteobacteria bacterium]MBW2696329.1 twin-arginine translocase TatA/TatE family subunit [Deltaproteobacteria bacterium]